MNKYSYLALLVLLFCSLALFAHAFTYEFDDDDDVHDEEMVLWETLMAIIHDDNIDEELLSAAASMATVKCVTATALNVRSGRGTNFPVVGSLGQGQRVEVSNVQGGWAQIGAGRFVSDSYLGSCGGSGGGGGSAKGQAAAKYARAQVGKCYSQDVNLRRGPRCFDCSGLVNKAWELQGVTVPWTTHGYPTSNMIRVAPSNVQPGDVLYRSGHVGMFVGNGEVVHAANTKQGVIKVKFSSFRYETIYRPRL